MSRWTNWLGSLDCTDNLKALKEAYEIGVMEMPGEIYKETGYQVAIFLQGLIPMLTQVLIAMSASTALGGVIGAAVGAFFGGAGAIPGAAIGAEAGFDLAVAVLTWMGLAFLIEAIGHGLVELSALLQLAVRRAWNAPSGPQRSQQIQLAGRDLARCGAILMRLVLQGIVAWLTKDAAVGSLARSEASMARLVAELRKSKLGPQFSAWIEANLEKLLSDPSLRPHRGKASVTKEASGEAQSPSQLRGQAEPMPKTESPKQQPGVSGPVKLTETKTISANEANQGFEKPPFTENSPVKEGRLAEDTTFVRLYDGENSGQLGRWMMPESEVRGLSPAQIQEKFALPQAPQYMTEVKAPAGTLLRVGEAGPIPGWGNGGGMQVQLMDRIPASAYQNARPYP
jgi:hypothetical protein